MSHPAEAPPFPPTSPSPRVKNTPGSNVEGETQKVPTCQVRQPAQQVCAASRFDLPDLPGLPFCFLDKLQKPLPTPTPLPCEPSACRERNSGKHHSNSAYHTHPRKNKNVSSSRLVARPGPRSQLLKQEATICSSLNIRQLAASFLPNFLGTGVASGKALHLLEFLVALSLSHCEKRASASHVNAGDSMQHDRAQYACYHPSVARFVLSPSSITTRRLPHYLSPFQSEDSYEHVSTCTRAHTHTCTCPLMHTHTGIHEFIHLAYIGVTFESKAQFQMLTRVLWSQGRIEYVFMFSSDFYTLRISIFLKV